MQPIIGSGADYARKRKKMKQQGDLTAGLESGMPWCDAEVIHIIHLLFYCLRVIYRLQQEKCPLHFSLLPGKWLIVFLDTSALFIQ